MQSTLAQRFRQHLARRQTPTVTLPVSRGWLQRAAQLPGKGFHVAFAITLAERRTPVEAIRLSQPQLRQCGVSRDASYDALGRLEEAGLIQVTRGRGRPPRILLVDGPHRST